MNSTVTLRYWKMFVRNVCVEHFLTHPQIIGGDGCTIEIDESLSPPSRNKIGRIVSHLWVFGGYEESAKGGFLVMVPSRDSATLVGLIKKFIRPGTTIISGSWRPQDRLGLQGCNDLRVNHRCNFMDPTSLGGDTLWQEAKRKNNRGEHGGNSYLAEYMWRKKFGNSPLKNIFQHIAEIFPV